MNSGEFPRDPAWTTRERPRVFVVDDESVISSTLALILQHSGFDALPFIHPLEALEAARLQAPDLLISDVMMPAMSGVELAIQVREHCPDCKVLLFSGQSGTSSLLETAKEKGYTFDILAKPVHPKDLLKKIESTFKSKPGHEHLV